jgi:hypothetical protein
MKTAGSKSLGRGRGIAPGTPSPKTKPGRLHKSLDTPRPGGFFNRRPPRVLALSLLLTIIAAPSLLPKFSVVDNDIWWHLKVGDWIIEHSAFPHTGTLSRTAADRPWMAYSWIYEVLLSFFHYRFHLMGVAVYGLLLTLAVTYTVFWMTRRLAGRFWGPSLLATLCCAAFLFKICSFQQDSLPSKTITRIRALSPRTPLKWTNEEEK